MSFTPGVSPTQFPYRLVASPAESGHVYGNFATEKEARAEQRRHAGSVVERYSGATWFIAEQI